MAKSEYDNMETRWASAIREKEELQQKYNPLSTKKEDVEQQLKSANDKIDELHLLRTIRILQKTSYWGKGLSKEFSLGATVYFRDCVAKGIDLFPPEGDAMLSTTDPLHPNDSQELNLDQLEEETRKKQ